uniref:tyrosine-type recombinase/integrase n=1 Tax=Pseudomonas sp. TaxID=306 RepID=UPI00286D68AF
MNTNKKPRSTPNHDGETQSDFLDDDVAANGEGGQWGAGDLDDADVDGDEDDDDEILEELESDFLNDVEEAAEAELATLLEETGGHVKQRAGNLSTKLELYPGGGFPISQYSLYAEDTWTLFKNQYGSAKKLHFGEMTPPLKELKKAISYYVLPDFAPFGTIRSYVTSYWQASQFSVVERYLLAPNFLDGSPESIAVINHRMINKALDAAKNTGAVARHYHSLFYMIRLWNSLSTQGLMPPGLALNIDIRKVDSIERRKNVIQHYAGSMSTWEPYSEEDLGELVDYALFWTEKAAPRLLEVIDYVKEKQLEQALTTGITRYFIDEDIEANLNVEVDGKIILQATRNDTEYVYAKGEKYIYSWLKSYTVGVDKVRNGVYILLALISGLRIGELISLKFDDLIKQPDGDYTLRVTRYKTSGDPNVRGEVDYIPIPKFIGQKIEELKQLRSIYTLAAQGFIFQASKGRKALTKPSNAMVFKICREISKETNVDRIHTHRFRKTIAEILINRDERNIDLIRHLFGHKSFDMTLRYIGRNPHLVRSVANAIEQNYTAEFTELVSAVKSGASSGPNAQRLLDRINARPDAFSGKQLKVTIFVYISHLLSSGEPLFIHRTAVGSYCLSTETYSSPNLPPCLTHMTNTVIGMLPNPTRCDISCEHAVVVEK